MSYHRYAIFRHDGQLMGTYGSDCPSRARRMAWGALQTLYRRAGLDFPASFSPLSERPAFYVAEA